MTWNWLWDFEYSFEY